MTALNPWVTLAIAGVLEVGWAIGLKYADGFTKPLPSALTILAMARVTQGFMIAANTKVRVTGLSL